MSAQRQRLEGWGTEERERVWWRRGYDPIGRHTMVATVLGVLFAALIGATLDPLNLRTADDLKRAELAAYEERYAQIEPSGYEAGVPYGEAQHLAEQIAVSGEGVDTPYGSSFREGWREGWNEALQALRAAAERHVPDGYTEFRVLEQLAPR